MKKLLLVSLLLFVYTCDKPDSNTDKTSKPEVTNSKGIGPITSVTLGPIDPKRAENGEKIFQQKCSSCHKITEKYVGPALKGATKRHSPEWIMNFVLNTEEMLQKDPKAIELLETYMTKMIAQGLNEAEARDVLEYLRKIDEEK
ncbi:MAG: cytochrome c [Leptospiraceae bacterium]|nr:cytochrome c [Leptospiraceae bacterium]MCP5500444.1 cytochrome c [Leptospiraceae bacterium]